MSKKIIFYVVSVLLLVFCTQFSFAEESKLKPPDGITEIEKILQLPEESIDIATAALTIDKIIDPSIDILHYLKKIEKIVRLVKKMPAKKVRLTPVCDYFFEKGPWNGYKVYAYDTRDPLGKNPKTHLLSTYLDTKLGNCVSMPLLFYIISNKIGIYVYLAKAPHHIFLQIFNLEGKQWNIDVTNQAVVLPKEYYIEKFSITKEALKNQIYLQPLDKKKVISVLLMGLVPFYLEKRDFQKALEVSDLALKYHPLLVEAYINKSRTYWEMSDVASEFMAASGKTEEQVQYINWLESKAKSYYSKAKSLGWVPEPESERQAYVESVRILRERLKNGHHCRVSPNFTRKIKKWSPLTVGISVFCV